MAAKTALITGGNTGIGFETAQELCRRGWAVTIACRDPARAAGAVQRIQAAVPGCKVDRLQLDLADLRSVRDAAAAWQDRGTRTDVLLNNAGVMAPPRMETKDGFELQLGTNHLGHFALTNLLLPSLQQQDSCRIVNVASTAHLFGKINFDDLNWQRTYERWPAYGQSKLANILFTYELARRLQPATNVTVNCLHPGVIRTELSRYLIEDPESFSAKLLTLLATPFTLTPWEGAQTSIYACTSPDMEGVTSKYLDKSKPVSSSPASYDLQTARRLWDVSAELIGAKLPAVAASLA